MHFAEARRAAEADEAEKDWRGMSDSKRLDRAAPSAAEGEPLEPPRVHFNYMSTEEDWRGFRAAIRMAREIAAQPCFDGVITREIQPGPHLQTDAERRLYCGFLSKDLRRRMRSTNFEVARQAVASAGSAGGCARMSSTSSRRRWT